MSRGIFVALMTLTLLALAACGGGSTNAPENAPRGFVSQLSKFDAPQLIEGVELVDATEYWTGAEARNGNAFPIRADPNAAEVVTVQSMPGGALRVRDGDKFAAIELDELRVRLEKLAALNSLPDQPAASCALLLVAHVDTPAETLARLCFTCVNARVGNLWLATRDKRDGQCRLLNLVLDPRKNLDVWYGIAPEVPDDGSAARLEWKLGLPAIVLAKGKRFEVTNAPKWGKGLALKVAEQTPRPRRLQLALQRDSTLRQVQGALHELAGAAFAEIEPLWPISEPTELVDATMFWRATSMSRTEIDTPGNPRDLFVRLLPDGKISMQSGAEWREGDIAAFVAALKPVADASRGDSGNALCTVNVLAGADAKWRSLLEVCKACVDCKVPALRLCTQERGVFGRLLPLKVDTTQAGATAYRVPDDQQANIVLMDWKEKLPSFHFGDGKGYGVDDVKDWAKALRKLVNARDPKPRRLLLQLPLDGDMTRLEAILAEPVSGRFLDIEPLWTALLQSPAAPRTPANFEDAVGFSGRIEPPELATYWQAVGRSQRLPSSAVVDPKLPVLYLCHDKDGRWSSFSAGKWNAHPDDEELRKLLETGAKLESESAVSSLQVVLGLDRRAKWQAALALGELMISARVSTLYVLTLDATGRYLFDLSLPLDGGITEKPVAVASVRNKVEDGDEAVQLHVEGAQNRVFRGETMFEDMRKAAKDSGTRVSHLSILLGGAESAEMCFRVFDALSPLEPLKFGFGVQQLAVPPTPEQPPSDD